jgi:ribosomal protein S2
VEEKAIANKKQAKEIVAERCSKSKHAFTSQKMVCGMLTNLSPSCKAVKKNVSIDRMKKRI